MKRLLVVLISFVFDIFGLNLYMVLVADFVLTKDFMFNLKAEYGLAEGGDEHAYGGGFRW